MFVTNAQFANEPSLQDNFKRFQKKFLADKEKLEAAKVKRQMLKDKYGERIDTVFMETTSLYGDIKGVSQYDGLKPFMKYGSMTESDVFLFPNDNIYMELRDRLRALYGNPEWNGSLVDPVPSTPKMREFNKIIAILKNHLKELDLRICQLGVPEINN